MKACITLAGTPPPAEPSVGCEMLQCSVNEAEHRGGLLRARAECWRCFALFSLQGAERRAKGT